MIPLYYHQKKWWNIILLFLLLPWYIRSFSTTISNHHHPRCLLFLTTTTTTTTTQLSLSQQQSSSKEEEEEEEDNTNTLEKENNESSFSTTTKTTTTRTTIKKKKKKKRRRNTNSFDVRWMERFEELVEYKKKYGDCCVPQSFEDNPSLGRWVRYQRFDSYKTKERVDKLNSIGFVWDAKEALWNAHVDELKSYQHKFGHVHVPQNGPPEYNKLSMWVQNQRVQYRYLMTQHNTTTTTTTTNNNNGDHSKNSPLQQLTTTTKQQNKKKKKSFLTPQRIATLESLGFVWDMNEVHWMEKWQMLKQFKEQYGHANVPSRYESNPTLARWVLHQRVQYKKQQQPTTTTTTATTNSASLSSSDNASSSSSSSKRLTPKRIDLLNSLNFVWDPSDSYWWEQYRALYNYRKENGHCSIPSNFHNLKLVHWVHNQRRLCREYVIAVSGMTTTTTTTAANNNNNNHHHRHPSNNNNNNSASSSSSSSSSWIPKDDIVIPVSGLNYERVVALRKIDFCWLPPLPGENSSTTNISNHPHHQQQQQQQQQYQQQNSNLNKNNLFGTPPTNHNHNREIMTTTTTTTTKKPQVMPTPPSRRTTTTIRIMPDGTKKQIIPFPWDEI